MSPPGARIGELDRAAIVETVLSRLGSQRSAWNAPDIRGEVEQQLTRAGVVALGAVRRELAEDLVARAVEASVPLLPGDNTPEHVRALTSPQVLEVEERLTTRLTTRAQQPALPGRTVGWEGFDDAQLAALTAIDGDAQLLVIEGAAGAGKTQMLAAARVMAETRRRRLVVVTPTLKASQVASRELGTSAFSAAWLIHQHGYRWDDEGHWTRSRRRVCPWRRPCDAATSCSSTRPACSTRTPPWHWSPSPTRPKPESSWSATATSSPPSAAEASSTTPPRSLPPTRLSLDVVHRFEDPEYAELSLLMRTRVNAPARSSTASWPAASCASTPPTSSASTPWPTSQAWSSPTPETKSPPSTPRSAPAASPTATSTPTAPPRRPWPAKPSASETSIATRRNDAELGVANRETWTVTRVHDDGALEVATADRRRTLPRDYALNHRAGLREHGLRRPRPDRRHRARARQ